MGRGIGSVMGSKQPGIRLALLRLVVRWFGWLFMDWVWCGPGVVVAVTGAVLAR
jgi:hypothetical protein